MRQTTTDTNRITRTSFLVMGPSLAVSSCTRSFSPSILGFSGLRKTVR